MYQNIANIEKEKCKQTAVEIRWWLWIMCRVITDQAGYLLKWVTSGCDENYKMPSSLIEYSHSCIINWLCVNNSVFVDRPSMFKSREARWIVVRRHLPHSITKAVIHTVSSQRYLIIHNSASLQLPPTNFNVCHLCWQKSQFLNLDKYHLNLEAVMLIIQILEKVWNGVGAKQNK